MAAIAPAPLLSQNNLEPESPLPLSPPLAAAAARRSRSRRRSRRRVGPRRRRRGSRVGRRVRAPRRRCPSSDLPYDVALVQVDAAPGLRVVRPHEVVQQRGGPQHEEPPLVPGDGRPQLAQVSRDGGSPGELQGRLGGRGGRGGGRMRSPPPRGGMSWTPPRRRGCPEDLLDHVGRARGGQESGGIRGCRAGVSARRELQLVRMLVLVRLRLRRRLRLGLPPPSPPPAVQNERMPGLLRPARLGGMAPLLPYIVYGNGVVGELVLLLPAASMRPVLAVPGAAASPLVAAVPVPVPVAVALLAVQQGLRRGPPPGSRGGRRGGDGGGGGGGGRAVVAVAPLEGHLLLLLLLPAGGAAFEADLLLLAAAAPPPPAPGLRAAPPPLRRSPSPRGDLPGEAREGGGAPLLGHPRGRGRSLRPGRGHSRPAAVPRRWLGCSRFPARWNRSGPRALRRRFALGCIIILL